MRVKPEDFLKLFGSFIFELGENTRFRIFEFTRIRVLAYFKYMLSKDRCQFSGRIGAIDFELLTTAILSHWKPLEIDWEKVVLSQLNWGQAESGMGFKYYY